MDIVGTDSPVLDGFPIPEPSGTDEAVLSRPVEQQQQQQVVHEESPPPVPQAPPSRGAVAKSRNFSRKKTAKDVNDIEALKCQKMILEMELLKLKIDLTEREKYKSEIQLYSMEKEHCLPPSAITSYLYQQSGGFDFMVVEDRPQPTAGTSKDILEEAIEVIIDETN